MLPMKQIILEEMWERKWVSTSIEYENQSSINMSNNPIYHAKSNHVETQYDFVKEIVQYKNSFW